MINDELEKLISYALADGILTDKERNVLMKKADELGVDRDELEMILEGRLQELNKKAETVSIKSEKMGDKKVCPGCQQIVAAFSSTCSNCGFEFRNIEANKSVETLSRKLEEVITECEKKSYKNMVGRGYGNEEEARKDDIIAKQRDVIKNFPIPNTREDILELLHFISPKTKVSFTSDRNLTAWRNKFSEIISRGKTAFSNDKKLFAEIEKFENQQKVSGFHKGILLLSGLYSTARSAVGLVVIFLVVGLGFGLYNLFGNSEIKKEETRLKGVETEITQEIRDKKFDEATILLNQLEWSVTENREKTIVDDYIKTKDKYQDQKDYWNNKKVELEKLIEDNKNQK